jgi:hypothetical protein
MQGRPIPQLTMLAFIDLEVCIPTSHRSHTFKRPADESFADLWPTFDSMYAKDGRTSTAHAHQKGRSRR